MKDRDYTIGVVRLSAVLCCVGFWYLIYMLGGVPLMLALIVLCLGSIILLVKKG